MLYNLNFGSFASNAIYPGAKVLTPNEVFDYSNYIMSTWPQYKTEPMIGFKILLKDTRPTTNCGEKIQIVEQNSQQLFYGRNCMMREGPITDINSYYLISLPVPRSMLQTQLNNISYCLQMLEMHLGIHRQAVTEVDVSGKTNMYETQRMMSSIIIPPQYMQKIIPSSGMMMGDLEFLNKEYACLRTKWNIPEPSVLDDMGLLAQLISSVFH
jgi:hypothetical protein